MKTLMTLALALSVSSVFATENLKPECTKSVQDMLRSSKKKVVKKESKSKKEKKDAASS